MICPECHTEYRDGYSHCSDCDVPLVHEVTSPSASLVPLARERSFEFVAELLDRLEKEDVPYVIEAGTATKLLDGEVTDIVRPDPWEARVWVPAGALEASTAILRQLETEWQAEHGKRPFHSRDVETRDFD